MIDTHTHLFSKEFEADRDIVIKNAIQSGVSKMLLPNVDLESIEAMHLVSEKYPDVCFPMMGLHPCSVKENWQDELAVVKSWLDKKTYCAVGEIGIDLYWDKTTLSYQQKAFRQQIIWAKEKKLPVVIHVREAFEETFEIVDELNDENLSGVFHCFTGNIDQANHIVSYGNFKLGIGGVVTFKNGGLDKVLPDIDLKHLVLETDSPYLAPVPHRGKRNESAYLRIIAEKLAVTKGVSIEEVETVTNQNALALFPTVK
ncbi:MAG: TatD family hydrolase [Crocinitomicaceae bacterium]|nr:TatD family hydrolase [Crocinitomicaceae bacterium]